MCADHNKGVPLASPLNGTVYWITGLPGSGKSTFARTLTKCLHESGRKALLMDADDIRRALGNAFGFGREDRRKVGAIYGRLALIISKQGYDVALATVSMFEDLRRWNRCNLPIYKEIYIQTPADIIVHRHPHGLYARALQQRVRNVPGVDQYIEEPINPDFIIRNDASMSPERFGDLAHKILKIHLLHNSPATITYTSHG